MKTIPLMAAGILFLAAAVRAQTPEPTAGVKVTMQKGEEVAAPDLVVSP